MFRAGYCSSSEDITLYIQQLLCVMRLSWLAVGRILYIHSSRVRLKCDGTR